MKTSFLETAINGLVNDNWWKWLFERCVEAEIFKEITSKGYRNGGRWNSGNRNSGDWNSGSCNSGDRNSGDRNSGRWNSGSWNGGRWNSGNRNSGDWNSGDWNSGDRNSGYFNVDTPEKILVFGKLTNRDEFENCYKPSFLYFDLTYWVSEKDMTDEEKANDPMSYVRGGQLRERDYKEAFKLSWENADKKDRQRIRDIPNFDKDIFFRISGIDVDKD